MATMISASERHNIMVVFTPKRGSVTIVTIRRVNTEIQLEALMVLPRVVVSIASVVCVFRKMNDERLAKKIGGAGWGGAVGGDPLASWPSPA